jgi:hypothetical protein
VDRRPVVIVVECHFLLSLCYPLATAPAAAAGEGEEYFSKVESNIFTRIINPEEWVKSIWWGVPPRGGVVVVAGESSGEETGSSASSSPYQQSLISQVCILVVIILSGYFLKYFHGNRDGC